MSFFFVVVALPFDGSKKASFSFFVCADEILVIDSLNSSSTRSASLSSVCNSQIHQCKRWEKRAKKNRKTEKRAQKKCSHLKLKFPVQIFAVVESVWIYICLASMSASQKKKRTLKGWKGNWDNPWITLQKRSQAKRQRHQQNFTL